MTARPDTCSPWGWRSEGEPSKWVSWDSGKAQRQALTWAGSLTAVTRPDTSEDVSSLRGGCSATQRRWALTSSSSLSS